MMGQEYHGEHTDHGRNGAEVWPRGSDLREHRMLCAGGSLHCGLASAAHLACGDARRFCAHHWREGETDPGQVQMTGDGLSRRIFLTR